MPASNIDMGAFTYHQGALRCGQLTLAEIATSTPTPFYCYSLEHIAVQVTELRQAFTIANLQPEIRYAVKANANAAILKLLANAGIGADTVSIYEIRKAMAAGISAPQIVFSGVGKRQDELEYAITHGISQINVESIQELHMLNAIAGKLGKQAKIALRYNPNVTAGAYSKISTARLDSKFGLLEQHIMEAAALMKSLPALQLAGLAIHIGSQITTLQPFAEAFTKLILLAHTLEQQGHILETIDFGGGIGAPYYLGHQPEFTITEYAHLIAKTLAGRQWRTIIEPGRYLVAGSSALVTKVLYLKPPFLILDAGMNDLMRPALYDAQHHIVPVNQLHSESKNMEEYDMVGPVCESSDIFGKKIRLPTAQANDLLAILGAGAYGIVLSNNYNLRPKPAEIIVYEGKQWLARAQQSYDEINHGETVPEWL